MVTIGIAAGATLATLWLASSGPATAATVDGQPILIASVDETAGDPLTLVESEARALRIAALEHLINQHVLRREAAHRGMTPMKLINVEVLQKIGPDVRPGEFTRRFHQLLAELRSKHEISILLTAPPGPRSPCPRSSANAARWKRTARVERRPGGEPHPATGE